MQTRRPPGAPRSPAGFLLPSRLRFSALHVLQIRLPYITLNKPQKNNTDDKKASGIISLIGRRTDARELDAAVLNSENYLSYVSLESERNVKGLSKIRNLFKHSVLLTAFL